MKSIVRQHIKKYITTDKTPYLNHLNTERKPKYNNKPIYKQYTLNFTISNVTQCIITFIAILGYILNIWPISTPIFTALIVITNKNT